ncbi:hypothetical protein ACMA1D_25285 [Streptomyces sp. 796.1]|uniref:hypothetical protein n=1 Tax=Streptomyces sp. 796.1 TaxID=3163029 RepID=UPI0039C95D15
MQTIRREVRIAGAAYCAMFAAVSLAWIIRDLSKIEDGGSLWWHWSGVEGPTFLAGSAYHDLLLLVLYVAVGAAALRSAVAGSALVAVAVATIGLRLPSLWYLRSGIMDYLPDGTVTLAQLTCWAAVLASVVLVAAVFAGRTGGPAAAGPTPLGVMAALLLLVGAGGSMIGWQFYVLHKVKWQEYEEMLTGYRYHLALLDLPPAWEVWFVALLAVVAGCAALRRAPSVRPLGLIAAFLVFGIAVFDVVLYLKLDYFAEWGDLPTAGKVNLLLTVAEAVAGLLAFLALAPRGPEAFGSAPPGAAPGGGAIAGWGPPGPSGPGGGAGPAGSGGFGPPPGAAPGAVPVGSPVQQSPGDARADAPPRPSTPPQPGTPPQDAAPSPSAPPPPPASPPSGG